VFATSKDPEKQFSDASEFGVQLSGTGYGAVSILHHPGTCTGALLTVTLRTISSARQGQAAEFSEIFDSVNDTRKP
jgi:hypothetical protein